MSNQMRIGIVTTWFERGAAYVSRQFMDVLQETDDVYIYARGGERYAKGDSKWDLPNVYWSKRHSGKAEVFGSTYIDKKDFVRWIKKNNIEAVIFNEQRWFQPILWCKELGIKTLAYVDYYTEKTLPLFNIFDALICNTKRHAFAFRNHPHAYYIKWGTDTELYKPSDNQNEKLTFFHSAGMAPVRKGTDFVLQAFYHLSNRKEVRLLIHTQVSLEQAYPELRAIIEEMESDGSLEIVNKTISAPGLYYRGDVYVYPSRLDGIGLTLMEAISSGLACITCDNPPMNEFVEPEFGLLCSIDYQYCRADGYYWPMCVSSIKSLTEQMERISTGKCDVVKMKQHARQYAIKELDFKNNFSILHNVIADTEVTLISDEFLAQVIHFDYLGWKKLHWISSPVYSAVKVIKHFI